MLVAGTAGHRDAVGCPLPSLVIAAGFVGNYVWAQSRASELKAILADAPTLQAQLSSATWVGGRRWDLSFQSGETVALPEGEQAARDALTRFAKADRSSGLLGRGLVRFDLRIPGKMTVRLPRAPGEAILPEPSSQAPAEG